MRRIISLLFLSLLVASSFMVTVESANSAVTKPSAPEFTLESVSYPYDVPTTCTTDPFSGETITHQGYHVENRTNVLKVKNQPFIPYTINGSEINLYYQVRMKGHYSVDGWYYQFGSPSEYPKQSTADYTIISSRFYVGDYNFQAGDKIDIQVQALVGSVVFVNGRMWGAADYHTFEGVEGDWSSTYVYTVGQFGAPSPSANPAFDTQNITSTPDQTNSASAPQLGFNLFEFAIVALLTIIAVLLTFVVFYFLKRNKKQAC